jgi:sulfur carrier protein ThiS
MEVYTLDRNLLRTNIIDNFHSFIWTERYYGDGDFELNVPLTREMIQKLPIGQLLSLNESKEIMLLETVNFEDNKLKATGISLLPWLNNRFIRTSAKHEEKFWNISGAPGWILWAIVYYMTNPNSPYLNGAIDIGIPNPQRFALPNLGLLDCDMSGNVTVAIPYGPVYNAMKEIATTYEIGMSALLQHSNEAGFSIGFRAYKGLDHTSGQFVNPVVRFSPHMDSFTGIKELQSIAALKTDVYVFAPGLNPEKDENGNDELDLRTIPGESHLTGSFSGFDLRAMLVFADDITTNKEGENGEPPLNQARLIDILNARALDALTNNTYAIAVDGEIVPESQFKYGVHYNLGDLIEVQGNSGVVQTARITEYIRSQDESGEKAYPTVTMLPNAVSLPS